MEENSVIGRGGVVGGGGTLVSSLLLFLPSLFFSFQEQIGFTLPCTSPHDIHLCQQAQNSSIKQDQDP